uniref:F-box domain-containing protein n=1 Tax=Panagrellus redivivus TaxID=6233 RepID=A0A7E4VJM3_PANRE
MSATLKPHLLIEVIGLQRQCLSPEKLCALFLADRNFSEAFTLAFYNRCDVLHEGVYKSSSFLTVKTRSGTTFKFNKMCHIPALLRIAGRLMHSMVGHCPNEPWIKPFFEGLNENRSLEDIFFGGERFLQQYAQGRDSISKLTVAVLPWLDHLKDLRIDTLVIPFASNEGNNFRCNVTNIETNDWTVRYNLFSKTHSKRLKFNKDLLKTVTLHGKVALNVALQMINTLQKVEEITFHDIRIILPTVGPGVEPLLESLHPNVNRLWAAMLKHSGTVTAHAVFKRNVHMSVHPLYFDCRDMLVDYDVTRSFRIVTCTHQKRSGAKVLNVTLKLSSPRFPNVLML